MTAPSATLALVYSGGPTNTNPSLSVGGQASTAAGKYVQSQQYSASTIPGVTIRYAAGNPLGAGTLGWSASPRSLSWTPAGGPTTTLEVGSGGVLALGTQFLTGVLVLEVNALLLPVGDMSQQILVEAQFSTVFGAPTNSDMASGTIEYRCLYLVNEGAVDATNVTLTLEQSAAASDVMVGSEYAAGSRYLTLAGETLLMDFGSLCTGTAPIISTYKFLPSETLEALHPRRPGPYFVYRDSSKTQDSDGISADLPVQLVSRFDGTGLSTVLWDYTLTWPIIKAGRMVSFFLRRDLPADPALPATEEITLTFQFTNL